MNESPDVPSSLLAFINLAEKLKTEKRNGHTSANKRESVADHCWRVSLMAILFSPYLDEKINVEKALKLAIIHDLPEIITGDQPYYEFLDPHSKHTKIEKNLGNKIKQTSFLLTKA